MRFVDDCTLELIAGNGGDGIIAWHREAHNANGGPSGGDGGNGGNIIFQADENVQSLFHLHHLKQVFAENGKNGGQKNMSGRNGSDRIVRVPVGTSVYDEKDTLICDFTKHLTKFLVCKGGRGGRGNAKFKSAQNRIPYMYERGELGEKRQVHLRLRYLANVGIVGLPNAGKSTLINVLANTRSRVANYSFTTLTPVLGVVKHHDQQLLFADIPGLIEASSRGAGLGHDFLKHAERCEVLIHLISMDPLDNADVVKAYKTIQNELTTYSPTFSQKKMIIVANKGDVDGAQDNYQILSKHTHQFVPLISAKQKQLGDLVANVFSAYNQTLHVTPQASSMTHRYYVFDNDNHLDNIKILNVGSIQQPTWKISHPQISYWYHRIPLTTNDNIQRFKHKLKKMGLVEILQKFQVQPNDPIVIDDYKVYLGELI